MTNSRRKGKDGELELAEFLRSHGFAARRGVQFKGGTESPDIVCDDLGGIHFECKRVEAGALYTWLDQAKRDCGEKVPVVAHRKSRQEWVAVMRLTDLLSILGGPPL